MRGAAGRVVNPARSPGLWQGQASQEPPTLFPRNGKRKFLPLGRQGLPEDGQRPSPMPSHCSVPPTTSRLGMRLGRGSDPSFAYKHLLSAYFKPKFSSPQGAATKTIPKCKTTAGSSGPQEADGQDQNSSWQGHIGYWRLTHAGKSVRLLQSLPQGRATLALPRIPWVGGGQKEEGQGFPGGAVVENLPANAGDTGSSPGLGRSHMPRSN